MLRPRQVGVMTRLSRIYLILGVLTCFVVVSGVVSSQAASHSLHHLHHDAVTHSNILCSLMCATGHVVHAVKPVLDSRINVVHVVDTSNARPITLIVPTFRFSRGPPGFSFLKSSST